MKKMTLLEIVQSVLSDTDGDNVSSVSDGIESLQVANIARDVYYNLMDEYNIPRNFILTKLEADEESTKPVYLKLPENVKRLEWVKYDVSTLDNPDEALYNTIRYVSPEEFIDRAQQLDASDSAVEWVTDYSGMKFKVKNNEFPTFYTSFDEVHLVFNSYQTFNDTQLQESKSLIRAEVEHEFDVTSDSFVPVIPDHLFSLYLAEVKNNVFAIHKQAANGKIEEQAKRLRYNLQRHKDKLVKPQRLAYGRR